MPERLPDFVVIGAMKCGTSTLHEQLALRSGLFLSQPKEPSFFSDDAQWERGLRWYGSLFDSAREGQRCGESSTHYTKLPTYPHTAERMHRHLPHAKLVYLMRDPAERIVSQYIHEWTQREVDGSLDDAVGIHERFVAYSSYAFQLEPFLRLWGAGSVLPVFFERMVHRPDEELARICAFLEDPSPEPPRWREDLAPQNVSSERLRRSRVRDVVRNVPILRALKDRLPESWRDRVKLPWRMGIRPELPSDLRKEIEERLDRDLARLGVWLGRELRCASWREDVLAGPLEWAAPPRDP